MKTFSLLLTNGLYGTWNRQNMEFIKNAVIESTTLTNEDHGVLSAWLHLNYGGSCQGFGGHALYLPKDFTHHKGQVNFAGHWIYRVLQIADVGNWDNLKGKTIRVSLDKDGLGGMIQGIGHIVKDDWFFPEKDFELLKT